MPLTTGEFHDILIHDSTDVGWAAVSPKPDMPATLVEAQTTGTSVEVYCIDAPTGTLAFAKGVVYGLTDDALSSVSAAWPKVITPATSGASDAIISGFNPAGEWRTFNAVTNNFAAYAAADTAALKAALP